MALQESAPDLNHQVSDAPVQVSEKLWVVNLQVAQVLKSYQVLTDLEYAVADATDSFHTGGQLPPQRTELSACQGPVAVDKLVPRISLEVSAGLDGAWATPTERTAIR